MKVTCNQQDLNKALSIVSHAIPSSSRSSMPILSNILLTVDHGGLKLVATNLEIGITCWIDAEIEQDGTTTIPAKLFSDFVNSLPLAPIEISVAEDTHSIRITGLRSRATIHGTEPSEFPSAPSLEGETTSLVLEAALLKQMISEVTIAASDDSNRQVFTGVHVEVSGDKLIFAAADAYRLAVRSISLPDYQGTHNVILIPARTLNELAHILPEDGIVHMIIPTNKTQVLFHTETMDLTSRLLTNTFPEFRNTIPQTYVTRAVIETKELMAMVKSVIPFAPNASHIAYMTIKPDENNGLEPGTVTLQATTEGVGENVSTLQAVVDGSEQRIIFNAKYLHEYLAVLKTSRVALELVSPVRPTVFRPVDIIDYTYVIMPMSHPQ